MNEKVNRVKSLTMSGFAEDGRVVVSLIAVIASVFAGSAVTRGAEEMTDWKLGGLPTKGTKRTGIRAEAILVLDPLWASYWAAESTWLIFNLQASIYNRERSEPLLVCLGGALLDGSCSACFDYRLCGLYWFEFGRAFGGGGY